MSSVKPLYLENSNLLPDYILIGREIPINISLKKIGCSCNVYLPELFLGIEAFIEDNIEERFTSMIVSKEKISIDESGNANFSIKFSEETKDGRKIFLSIFVKDMQQMIESIRTSSFLVSKYYFSLNTSFKNVLSREGNENNVFYKEIGGKDQCIIVEVEIYNYEDKIASEMTNIKIKPRLLYENGELVNKQNLLMTSSENEGIIKHGLATMKFRIDDVSSKHGNNKFCIQITHDSLKPEIIPCSTFPIDVRSKVNKYRDARKIQKNLIKECLFNNDDDTLDAKFIMLCYNQQKESIERSINTFNDIIINPKSSRKEDQIRDMLNNLDIAKNYIKVIESSLNSFCIKRKRDDETNIQNDKDNSESEDDEEKPNGKILKKNSGMDLLAYVAANKK